MNQDEIQNQVFKVGSAWALIGVSSWSDLAAFFGAMYTAVLLAEWCWKKLKPVFVHRGWIADRSLKGDRRKHNDE